MRETTSAFMLLCVICALIIFFTNDILVMMIALALPVVMAWNVVKADFLHPLIWFGIAYMLYADSAPLLAYMELDPIMWGGYKFQPEDFVQAMRIQGVAGIACFMVLGIGTVDVRRPLRDPAERWKIGRFIWPLFLVLFVASLYLIRSVAAGGFADKYDLIARGGALSRASFIFIILATLSVTLIIQQTMQKRYWTAWAIVIAISAFFLIVVLTMGQRNYFFRWGVLLVLIASAFGFTFRAWLILPAAGAGAILMAAMNYMKMSLVRSSAAPEDALVVGSLVQTFLTRIGLVGVTEWGGMTYVGLFLYVGLSAEFSTPGMNLALLVGQWPTGVQPFGLTNIVGEMVTALAPGFLNAVPQNAVSQVAFMDMFFPGALTIGKGYGCGLVPEGYMSFGFPGAVMLMMAVGLMIRWAYRRAEKGLISFLFYINVIPIAAFALRADMTSIYSQSWKHVLLPLLMVYFANRLWGQYQVMRQEREVAGVPLP